MAASSSQSPHAYAPTFDPVGNCFADVSSAQTENQKKQAELNFLMAFCRKDRLTGNWHTFPEVVKLEGEYRYPNYWGTSRDEEIKGTQQKSFNLRI